MKLAPTCVVANHERPIPPKLDVHQPTGLKAAGHQAKVGGQDQRLLALACKVFVAAVCTVGVPGLQSTTTVAGVPGCQSSLQKCNAVMERIQPPSELLNGLSLGHLGLVGTASGRPHAITAGHMYLSAYASQSRGAVMQTSLGQQGH